MRCLHRSSCTTDCVLLWVSWQAMSCSGRFLVTADRDGRVRISHYPQTHVVYGFAMGHTQYVEGVWGGEGKSMNDPTLDM